MEAVAAHALVVIGARQRERVGDEGMAAMEGGVEAGDLRHRREAFIAASMPAMLCGSCRGASGMSLRSFVSTEASTSVGWVRSRPPWTTRCPTATIPLAWPTLSSHPKMAPVAA